MKYGPTADSPRSQSHKAASNKLTNSPEIGRPERICCHCAAKTSLEPMGLLLEWAEGPVVCLFSVNKHLFAKDRFLGWCFSKRADQEGHRIRPADH